MPNRLQTALDRLQAWLEAHDAPVVNGLQPGVSADEVRERLAEFGLEPPEELLTWFGWHSGYVPPPDATPAHQLITGSVTPISLDRACQWYVEFVRRSLEALWPEEGTSWFPVFFINQGTALIDCGGTGTGTIACYEESEFPDDLYRPATLAEPVEWWLQQFDSGGYPLAPGGGFLNQVNKDTLTDVQRRSGLL